MTASFILVYDYIDKSEVFILKFHKILRLQLIINFIDFKVSIELGVVILL